MVAAKLAVEDLARSFASTTGRASEKVIGDARAEVDAREVQAQQVVVMAAELADTGARGKHAAMGSEPPPLTTLSSVSMAMDVGHAAAVPAGCKAKV